MNDEFDTFARLRPAAPPYPPRARAEARRRLLDAARRDSGGRRPAWLARFRPVTPRGAWQAAGAFALTAAMVGGVTVALSGGTGEVRGPAVSRAVASDPPPAPETFPGEPNPQPGKFIRIDSEMMFTSEGDGGKWLYRSKRAFYRAVDGRSDGLLWSESLAPKAFPGLPLPEQAKRTPSGGGWNEVDGLCPGRPQDNRRDYVHLAGLPADEQAMLNLLYRHVDREFADREAFHTATDMLRETYMPRAQRQALLKAIAMIPGVEPAQDVADSAGRKGAALGMTQDGVLTQLIYDPLTSMFLGERGTIVDEKTGGGPVGGVVALTAQTSVTVVDKLPEAPDAAKDSTCEMAAENSAPGEATPAR
ncbi:hypothetical protein Misp01_33140 [Microtetraspora sp. NBRC 13810]|uniref:CU044_5270 family protein n=1 Tax=Microtetraspora sp. NBRC 13810 TaxID=3030990 RepID=UPI0024A05BDE|nr:CU044_5270 family protein [Microtetraspora sp. NBRC 13810]GLW08184.1 hypothetical protein Misp01_33140 [Microtetraspora sp. NBRC 13810]